MGGTFHNAWRHFWLSHLTGIGGPDVLQVDWDAAIHPAMHMTGPPPIGNDRAPNVDSAGLRNPAVEALTRA